MSVWCALTSPQVMSPSPLSSRPTKSALLTVTLVVAEEEAEQLAHASVSWTVTLALLPPDGAEATDSQ